MKITVKNVKLTNGKPALKVTADYDTQSVNFLRKWGNWRPEKKYWLITEDVERFIPNANMFYGKMYGTSPVIE